MYFNKKMNNHFNKFNENLFIKNEMTLYLKKINKITKTAILNTFDISI